MKGIHHVTHFIIKGWLAVFIFIILIMLKFKTFFNMMNFAEKQEGSPDLRITEKKIQALDEEIIPVFYNVFTDPKSDGSLAKSIVDEQMKGIHAIHQVFVRSIGKQIQIENASIVQHDDEGDEAQTLGLLYWHCVENPIDTVVYLHNKGSFHPSEQNDRLRRFLTRGALSEECAHMPDPCNICSSRFSPLPHPHTSGNMWVAKCAYVQKLINPTEFQQKMEDMYHDGVSIKGITPAVAHKNCANFGLDRFAAEHWIHSHPSAVSCDLLSDDNQYTWGYDSVPDEDFQIDLKVGPRFDKSVYQKNSIIDPLRIQQEYLALYNESTPKNWWGWDFYKSISKKDLYNEYYWDELPTVAKNASKILGFNQKLWDSGKWPRIRRKLWKELTTEEQKALGVLGYNQNDWR